MSSPFASIALARPVLALAPMDGVTDSVVRGLFSSLGGLDYCVTEFLRISGEVPPARTFLRDCPELAAGGRTSHGLPVHLQLLGGDAGRMAESAARAVQLGAGAIDLNYGCPAPTVNRHDGGASLLRTPCRLEEVTRAVRAAVPAQVPVSAKIRLGWDDPDAVVELALAVEAGGASWLTIHGRTRAQGYLPPADWKRIGRAREALSIPVVANGDINSPEDFVRCREETGCSRFMLGRGAIARPELFRLLRGDEEAFWPAARRLGLLLDLAAHNRLRFVGPDRERGILSRVKMWCRAMSTADAEVAMVWNTLKHCDTLGAALALVTAFRASAGLEDGDGSFAAAALPGAAAPAASAPVP